MIYVNGNGAVLLNYIYNLISN